QVCEDQLRGKVKNLVPLPVPHPASFGVEDRHRSELLLSTPRVEDMFAVQLIPPAPRINLLLADTRLFGGVYAVVHCSSFFPKGTRQTQSKLPESLPWRAALSGSMPRMV